MLPDVELLPVAIRMSERQQCSVRVLFGRAELSEVLFRDKAKSTLLSINGALMSNGNKGITAKFKRPCHLPRVRILEVPI